MLNRSFGVKRYSYTIENRSGICYVFVDTNNRCTFFSVYVNELPNVTEISNNSRIFPSNLKRERERVIHLSISS